MRTLAHGLKASSWMIWDLLERASNETQAPKARAKVGRLLLSVLHRKMISFIQFRGLLQPLRAPRQRLFAQRLDLRQVLNPKDYDSRPSNHPAPQQAQTLYLYLSACRFPIPMVTEDHPSQHLWLRNVSQHVYWSDYLGHRSNVDRRRGLNFLT